MKKIILVEDDPTVQDTFSLVFAAPDYEITGYTSGEELYKKRYVLPDLFVLDKQLSGADGLDICRYLKSQPESRDIPVVMISANPGIIPLAHSAGADNVLLKPYRLADLRNIVNRYL